VSKRNLELYKKLYLIRRAEEAIVDNYSSDDMKTPMHMSTGEEAIVVGVCEALGKNSSVFGTYRSHALYLAKTGETDKFFAEMYGKSTGVAKGKAGSMHLSYPEAGFWGASAIVASNIPLAAGAAFANKYNNTGKITAVFFGDGAVGEGNFWESLNSACLMRLPILFVCEDNELAMHAHISERNGFKSLNAIISAFNCNSFYAETTDVEQIFKLANKAVNLIKKNHQPSFLHLRYYRYLEHVGINEDFDAGYRSKKDFEMWLKRDPVALQRKKILDSGIREINIVLIEEKIDRQIEKSIKYAQKAPLADIKELYTDIFYEK